MQDKELSLSEFRAFQQLIYSEIGISLADHKRTLVQSRLRKWLAKFNLNSYSELYDKIANDASDQMLILLVNAITTNVTSFFREESQWIYMQENIQKIFDSQTKKIRIWSAACSSGQEPYSIIIFLKEHLQNFDQWDIKILATDISQDILKKAMQGAYSDKELENIPKSMLTKHFNSIKKADGKKYFVIKNELKRHITFRSFNLVTGNFNMFKNYFDMIFCRNVMIYFDRETQNQLLGEFARLLHKNSLLFIGHSESIQRKDGVYKLVAPSIYKLG